MKYLLILSLTLVLARKGRIKTDPRLTIYVNDFKATAAKNGVKTDIDFPVIFETYRDDVSGVCNSSWLFGGQLVRINKKHFDSYPENMRRMLLFHELAHCGLGSGHDKRKYKGTRLSWMAPEMFNFEYRLIPGYERELFLGKDDLIKKLIDNKFKR